MEKAKIVFVDYDEDYLMALVLKFLHMLKDDIEIAMITDQEYLTRFLEQQNDISILVINEKFGSIELTPHKIGYVFYLVETTDEAATEPAHSYSIYKYSSVNEIYMRVSGLTNLESSLQSGKGGTKINMIYSPIGDSGKTFTALGIAKALSALKKKVLYLNVELIQNFNYFLLDQTCIDNRFGYLLAGRSERLVEAFQETIRNEGFDYLPPFEQSATALNVTMDSYLYLLDQLKKLNLYEYIILDTSSEFNQEKAMLMAECDKVLIITRQDKMSLWKMDCFLRNIDFSNRDKFMFLCNSYDTRDENLYMNDDIKHKYTITEYIKRIPHRAEGISTANIGENSSFQKIAYYLL